MANHSAVMGHASNSQSDAWIRRAMLIIAPSQLNPNASQPFGPPRPPGYTYETRGEMSKQVTKSHVRDAVHMYLVN